MPLTTREHGFAAEGMAGFRTVKNYAFDVELFTPTGNMPFPRAPVFHAYEPALYSFGNWNDGVVLAAKVPRLDALPAPPPARDGIPQGQRDDHSVEYFLVAQEVPAGQGLPPQLLRGHYWALGLPSDIFSLAGKTMCSPGIETWYDAGMGAALPGSQAFHVMEDGTLGTLPQLVAKHLHVHDGQISNHQGGIYVGDQLPVLLYSVLRPTNQVMQLDDTSRCSTKTAITLHWLLDASGAQALRDVLKPLTGQQQWSPIRETIMRVFPDGAGKGIAAATPDQPDVLRFPLTTETPS